MILAHDPGVLGQVRGHPSADDEGRLATAKVRLGRLPSQHDHAQAMPTPGPRPGPPQRPGRPAINRSGQASGGRPSGPPARGQPGHADAHRADGDQDEPHALPLGQAEGQEGVADRHHPQHPPRGPLQSKAGRNSRKIGPNWCEKLSKRSGSQGHRPERREQVPGGHRHRPLDRVEHLVDPRRRRRPRGRTGRRGCPCMNISPRDTRPRPPPTRRDQMDEGRRACQRAGLLVGRGRRDRPVRPLREERAHPEQSRTISTRGRGRFHPDRARPAPAPGSPHRQAGGRSPARWPVAPTGVQAWIAALPKAASATSFSGAPIPLETAGTSKATVPAHRARSPRTGRAIAATFSREGQAQQPLHQAAGHRTPQPRADRVEGISVRSG